MGVSCPVVLGPRGGVPLLSSWGRAALQPVILGPRGSAEGAQRRAQDPHPVQEPEALPPSRIAEIALATPTATPTAAPAAAAAGTPLRTASLPRIR